MANQYNAITTRVNGQTITADWFNVLKTTLVNNGAVKHNIAGTTAPTTGDDSDDNYEPGSTWTDVTADKYYVCLDSTSSSAVWKEVATLSSGVLPISLGGTGQSTQTEGFDALSPTTSTGDIIYHDGSDNVRLAAGTDGHVLTLSSGEPVWQSAPSGTPADTSKTTTYTATTADEYIRCDTSSAAFTVTLYTAVGNAGKRLTLIKTNSDLDKPLTIDGASAETVNGSATFLLYTAGESVTIESDGAGWVIVGRYIPSEWTSFTPTGDFTTATTYDGFWKRNGDSVEIQMELSFSGTPNSTSLDVNMPTNMTIDTGKIFTTGVIQPANSAYCVIKDDSTGNSFFGSVYINTSTTLRVIRFADVGSGEGIASVTQADPVALTNLDTIRLSFSVPISGWEG